MNVNAFFHPSIFFVACALIVWMLPGRIARWLPPVAAALFDTIVQLSSVPLFMYTPAP